MIIRSKLTSKLATLEAARAIFFIVVGLGIKESLGIFSISSLIRPQNWHWATLLAVGAGYLFTAIRFSHGVSTLHSHEKERIEQTNLPSASKISTLALFIILLAVFLYLMAINITNFQRYVCFTLAMLLIDLCLIGFSRALRQPFLPKTLYYGKQNTKEGYQARAAWHWIWSDFILLGIGIVLLIYHEYNFVNLFLKAFAIKPIITLEFFWGFVLVSAGFFDYFHNRAFYFGGADDWQSHKFIFICSPLSPSKKTPKEEEDKVIRDNIDFAQYYCWSLMKQKLSLFSQKKITPFASHCFYTYFLNDQEPKDRSIGRQCALAYLSACDAINIYVPNSDLIVEDHISSGMKHEIEEAQKLGLEVNYLSKKMPPSCWTKSNWHTLKWKRTQRKNLFKQKLNEKKITGLVEFEGNSLRKRVYVCTHLRGLEIDETMTQEEATQELKRKMKENVKSTLWQCHELARDDEAFVAPFAPQAFFTYFWKFPIEVKRNEETKKWKIKEEKNKKWERWFESSLEILKVCDAVYIYTEDGLPDSKCLSSGMIKVRDLAERLGIEIRYKQETPVNGSWNPAVPDF